MRHTVMRRSDSPLVSLCLVLLASSALAADPVPHTDTVTRVIPFDGVLAVQGGEYGEQAVDMAFTLYDAPEGGDPLWTEEWSRAEGRPVPIERGRFTVNLGTHEAIEDTIYAGGTVHLGVRVKYPDTGEWTALAGRQRINPVPFSLWTARATDFDVAEDAYIAGSLNVGTDANVQDLEVKGDANLGQVLSLDADGASGDGGRAMYQGDGDQLIINTNDEVGFSGGTRIKSDLTVGTEAEHRNTTLYGDLVVNGTLTAPTCRLCFNYHVSGWAAFVCARMEPGFQSLLRWFRPRSSGRPQPHFGMVFLCDDGADESGGGNMLPDGTVCEDLEDPCGQAIE